jgi:hypothetical protein
MIEHFYPAFFKEAFKGDSKGGNAFGLLGLF